MPRLSTVMSARELPPQLVGEPIGIGEDRRRRTVARSRRRAERDDRHRLTSRELPRHMRQRAVEIDALVRARHPLEDVGGAPDDVVELFGRIVGAFFAARRCYCRGLRICRRHVRLMLAAPLRRCGTAIAASDSASIKGCAARFRKNVAHQCWTLGSIRSSLAAAITRFASARPRQSCTPLASAKLRDEFDRSNYARLVPVVHDRIAVEQGNILLLRHGANIVQIRRCGEHGFHTRAVLQVHQHGVRARSLYGAVYLRRPRCGNRPDGSRASHRPCRSARPPDSASVR